MTIKTEILEKLRKKTPLVEIRRDYRSQSQLYEAIREFLVETEKIVEEKQKELKMIEGDLLGSEDEVDRINIEKAEISGEIQELVQAKKKLGEEVARKVAEADRLNATIKELQGKDFTPEILSKIMVIESRSGPNLLRQIKTVEEYKQIKKEFSNLKKSKAALEGTVQNLRARKEKLEKRLRSERNQFDAWRLKTSTFREAVAIVSSLFQAGYSTGDIKSLKHGLNMLGIKDNPLLSIKRLVEGLLKYENLVALQDKIRAGEKKLKKLKSAISDAKSELRVAKQLLRVFQEVRDAGIAAMTGTAEQAKTEIADVARVSEKHVWASTGKFDRHVQHMMEGVRTELGKWGNLREEEGRLKEFIHPALVLLGILKSPEYLRQLPLTVVFQLFDRLHLWSEMTQQDVTIRPSKDIWKKDVNLNYLQSYRLPVLIEFVCEGLREIMVQRSRKE